MELEKFFQVLGQPEVVTCQLLTAPFTLTLPRRPRIAAGDVYANLSPHLMESPHWPLGVMWMRTLGGFYNLGRGRFLATLPLMLLRRETKRTHQFPLPAGYSCSTTISGSPLPTGKGCVSVFIRVHST